MKIGMSRELFYKWFEESFLPNITTNSIVVMASASYHLMVSDTIANYNSRKDKVINYPLI